MSQVTPNHLDEFSRRLRGSVVTPDHPEYQHRRTVWNAMIDRHPAVVLRCADVTDVRTVVEIAARDRLPLAVRGGGHSVAGLSTCDDGVVLDLSALGSVQVDAQRRRARVGGGAIWRTVDAATSEFGLATTGGVVSHTGVAGLTLGGGIGYLMRTAGLTCDNVISYDLVTAGGDRVTVDRGADPELFWALRGGGGNFGVVTSFEFGLHPIGPDVLFGLMSWPIDQAAEVIQAYRELTESAPDSLMTYCLLSPGADGAAPSITLQLLVTVPPERAIAEVGHLGVLGRPLLDLVTPTHYPEIQSMFDDTNPHGLRNYWKAHFLDVLSAEFVELMLDWFERKPRPTRPGPVGGVIFEHLGGEMSRVGLDESAFPIRDATYGMEIISIWDDASGDDDQISWTRGMWTDLARFARQGAYSNYLVAEDTERFRDSYDADRYRRLVAVKNRLDPDNLFALNHNVVPDPGIA